MVDEDAEQICLECFHPSHPARCPTCGIDCGRQRAARLLRGAVRVLYAVVVLLLFFAVVVAILGAFASGAWVRLLPEWARVPAVIVVGTIALVLRATKPWWMAKVDARDNPRSKTRADCGADASDRPKP